MNETIDNGVKTTKRIEWKNELDELKKQKSNKGLPVPVQRLIEGEITKLEERLERYDEYSNLLVKTQGRIERLNSRLSDLKKMQREFEVFLGVDGKEKKAQRPKFVLEDVVAFIKKNNGSVTYSDLSQHTGLGRIKLKRNMEKNAPVFKLDTTVKPTKVSLK